MAKSYDYAVPADDCKTGCSSQLLSSQCPSQRSGNLRVGQPRGMQILLVRRQVR